MTISSIMTTALSGMQTEQNRMATAASSIASVGGPAETEAEINLVEELRTVMSAETGFAANAMVFETGADLWDVLMSIKQDSAD